ncbi:hypothetical protein ACVW00_003297 [Marmoricola sp. URHA0025 HA25]
MDLRAQGELEAGTVACQAHEQETGLLEQRRCLPTAWRRQLHLMLDAYRAEGATQSLNRR